MTTFADPSTASRLPSEAEAALRVAVSGAVITPDDPGYDEARPIHNFAFDDRRPGALVRVTSTEDVAAAVRVARAYGLPIAVRSGGHSFAGHSSVDGALVIDLGALKSVAIDPTTHTATVGAGVTSGDLAGPASAFGLAVSTGDTSSVALGGLVTGGGVGWLARKQGLAVDNLLAATIVTAEGEVLRASEEEHPDLFWAIRGGGGNFGIVTEFELRMHHVGMVQGGVLVLPASREVLRGYIDYVPEATEDLTTIAFLMHAPPAPFIPEAAVGSLVLLVGVCYTGDSARRDAALAPLRSLATPVVELVETMPYPALFAFTQEGAKRHGGATRSMFTDNLDDAALDALLEAMHNATSPVSMVQVRGLGGAVSSVPADATAYVHRERRLLLAIIGGWLDPAEDGTPHRQWVLDLWERLSPASQGAYANFLEEEGEMRVREAYRERTFARLQAVKRAYDPQNVFRFNQNVKPALEGGAK